MSRLDQLKKLAEQSPDDPLTHYAIGLEYFNLELFEEAIREFAQALRVDPNYSTAYYHKARAEIRARQHETARNTLTAGIEVAQAAGDAKTEREMTELRDTIS